MSMGSGRLSSLELLGKKKGDTCTGEQSVFDSDIILTKTIQLQEESI